MANPNDAAALADAFIKAHYLVPQFGEDGRIHVGVEATALQARLPAAAYGFITAWNPDSTSASRLDNDRADGALAAALDRSGIRRLRAHAQDDQGGHREDGWLVVDAQMSEIDRLARQFGQDGVLAWQAGNPARLRLYHSQPADAAGRLWVDWVG